MVHNPVRGSGQGVVKKYRGSSRAGSEVFRYVRGRVGLGRVRTFSSVTRRARLTWPDPNREIFIQPAKNHDTSSVTWPDPNREIFIQPEKNHDTSSVETVECHNSSPTQPTKHQLYTCFPMLYHFYFFSSIICSWIGLTLVAYGVHRCQRCRYTSP